MFLLDNGAPSEAQALYDSECARSWSYSGLTATVEAAASALRSSEKALVFLFCRNNAATVFAYLAAIHAGHAVALLDESLAAEFRTRLIKLYRPEYVIASVPFEPEAENWNGAYTVSQDDAPFIIWRRKTGDAGAIHPALALLLSTSGSTGTPKFVRLTRANVEANADSIRAALEIGPNERPVTSLPIHYSYGLSVLNSHLKAGAAIVLTNAGLMSPEFWNVVRSETCTSWAGVPYSYQILRRLDLNKLNVPSLATLTQAGGKLDRTLVAEFHRKISERNGRFFVMYGQTEATARIAILPSGDLPGKLGSAGRAIPGGSIRIEKEAGKAAEAGESGEVVYYGPNVMMGYATSREDLALGDAMHGCLRTGDLGYLDPDGYLFLTGRRQRDAKVLGLRLNMDEIEEMLRPHGPTAVLSGEEKLLIYCEYGDEHTLAQYRSELAARLKLHIGAFEFRRIEQLPLKANGKIDYQKLSQQP